MINAYRKIYQFGSKPILDILRASVIIEEKIDGSQLSFRLNPDTGELEFRSKNRQMDSDKPGIFKSAIENIQKVKHLLNPNYTYIGEYVSKPKHNVLEYGRVPLNDVMIFDIRNCLDDNDSLLSHTDKSVAAHRIGFETVPLLFSGQLSGEGFGALKKELLEKQSVLGGCNRRVCC